MYDELERLRARLAVGETSPAQALLRLRPLLLPRAIWCSLSLEGSTLSLAEVTALVDALERPRTARSALLMRPEAQEIKPRCEALSLALDAAAQNEAFSVSLLCRLHALLAGRPPGEPSEEPHSEALSALFAGWESRHPAAPLEAHPEAPEAGGQEGSAPHPIEDAAWLLREMARRRPFREENDATSRLAASFLLVRAGLPPLLFGQERREAYIEALKASFTEDLAPLVRFLTEEASLGLEELLAAERAAAPVTAARLGAEIAERQRALWRRLEASPAADPELLEARGAEVDALSTWVDYVLGRVESSARGPLFDVKRAPVRSDWAMRLLGALFHPLYVGRGAALSLRISPHREAFLPDRPIRFPAAEAALTVFVVATRASLRLLVSSPQASAIREARRRPGGAPGSRPSGLHSLPPPTPEDVAQAKLELDGPPFADDWPRLETEAWLLSWVERLVRGYELDLIRLNGLGERQEKE